MRVNGWIKIFVSAILVAFVFYKIGISKTLQALVKVQPGLLALVIIISFVSIIIGALNIQILLKGFKYKIGLLKLSWHYLVAWAVGIFLPSKIGEFSLVLLLKKENFRMRHTLIVSIFDKLCTVLVVIAISFAGILILFRDKPQLLVLCALVGAGCILVLAIILSRHTKKLITKLISRWASKVNLSVGQFQKEFLWFLRNHFWLLVINVVLTAVKWFFMALSTYVLFLALGVYVPLYVVWIINCILTVAGLVPISADGLGIREGLGFVLFSGFVADAGIIGAVLAIHLAIKYALGLAILLVYLPSRTS